MTYLWSNNNNQLFLITNDYNETIGFMLTGSHIIKAPLRLILAWAVLKNISVTLKNISFTNSKNTSTNSVMVCQFWLADYIVQ